MREYIYESIKDSDGVDCYIKRGEIVRCKDCKHGKPYDDGGFICEAIWHDDNWYCADGERRDDDG